MGWAVTLIQQGGTEAMSTRPGLSFPYQMMYRPPINHYVNFIYGVIRYMAQTCEAIKYVCVGELVSMMCDSYHYY